MFDAVAHKLRYLRLKPFDTGTEAGRRDERHRLAVLGAGASLVYRAAAALAVILSVRLTLPWLGAERFGVWATFASLVAMLSFLDLGVGNALVNRVAAARARDRSGDDGPSERTVIAAGLVTLVAFACAAAACLSLAAWVVPWHRVFRTEAAGALTDEAQRTAFVFAWLFGLQLIASGVLKILHGQQRMHVAQAVSAVFALISCATLWWASTVRAGVPELLLSVLGVQLLAGLVVLPMLWRSTGTVPTTGARSKSSMGATRNTSWRDEARALLGAGSLYLVLQIGTMIAWGADSLILASMNGAAMVAVYAVAQRLFQFASQPWSVVNAPLWAAYADAHVRGDRDYVRSTLKRSLRWTFAGAFSLAAMLGAAGPWLVPIWTGNALQVPVSVLVLFAVWCVVESVGNALAMYLNGCGIVRQQVVVVVAFVLLAIPAKIVGAWWGGAAGLLAASLVVYLLAVVLPYATLFRRDILKPLEPLERREHVMNQP